MTPKIRALIFVTEGDASTPSGSGSGTPYSVIQAFREMGTTVHTVDAELYGARKLMAAAQSWSRSRPVWRARYRLGNSAFASRSMVAQSAVRRLLRQHPEAVVLQYGAGCQPMPDAVTPLFLYCDNFTKHTIANGFSNAAQLSTPEYEAAIANEGRVYERAAHVFTMSEYIRKQFVSQCGLPVSKLSPVYAGYPITDAASTRGGASPSRPRVVFVGRDWDSKGGDSLFRVFLRQRALNPTLSLAIVGPRTRPPETENVAGVDFFGYLDKADPAQRQQLADVYESATIFALPTRYDSFGIAVLEAMSHRLPIILTNIGALPEIVLDGETGLLVPPDDDAALEAALGALLADSDRARRMGEAGYHRATQLFSWSSVASKMAMQMVP